MLNADIESAIADVTEEITQLEAKITARMAYREGLQFALNGSSGKRAGAKPSVIVHRRNANHGGRKRGELHADGFTMKAIEILRNASGPMHITDIAKIVGTKDRTSIYTHPEIFRKVAPGIFDLVEKVDKGTPAEIA